jgi:hypothetical protein
MRPTIGNAPATVAYGSAFAISTPNASNISSIALIRAGSPTHAFDMDQRMVGLSFTDQGNGTLMVNAPANGNLAPPGYYMLFVVNSAGVPSIANWVQVQISDFSLGVTPQSQQVPQGGSTSFTATVTPQSGFTGTVNLGTTGLPAGVTASFSVPSLTSGDSTLNVMVGNSVTPGTYPFTITAVSGTITHNANATLEVQAPDFALSVAPPLQQVLQGGSTSFTATVTPQNGFTGTVTLSESGLPAGVTANFTVTSLTSGDSTLNVTVGNSVTPGTYPFTITGTSGTLTHSANASLEVQAAGDYAVTVTPASRKIPQGAKTSWTATVTPQNGFTDPVTLSVSGLPAGVTAAFTVPTLTSGNSTLNVAVDGSVAPGTYPFTITGTSGTRSHSANATLIVLVQGSYTVTITPASQTVTRNSSSTYTVAITPLKGFHWTVDLTVQGTGGHITASLDPASVGPTGTSTLTVNVDGVAARGLHTLRVIGKSGQLSKVGKLALTVQ